MSLTGHFQKPRQDTEPCSPARDGSSSDERTKSTSGRGLRANRHSKMHDPKVLAKKMFEKEIWVNVKGLSGLLQKVNAKRLHAKRSLDALPPWYR